MAPDLAKQYAKSMTHQPYGHALYVPVGSGVLQPGSVGYIDEEGSWQPIISNIEHAADLESGDFSSATDMVYMSPSPHIWGPKTSTSVSGRALDLSGGVSAAAAGLPVGATAAFEYRTSNQFGAILHCPQQVIEEGYYHHDPFVRWAKNNAQAIFNTRSEIWERDFYLVRKVFQTSDVWINAGLWQDRHVTMGFKLTIEALGELGPHGEFSQGHTATGWERHQAKQKQNLVVFFTFVRMKYMPLPFGSKRHVREVRGVGPVTVEHPSSGQFYEMTCETTED